MMTTAVTPLLGQWRAQAVPAVKPQTDCWVSVRPLNHKAVLPSPCSTQTTQLIALILMFATCFLLLKLCQLRHPFPKPEFLRFQTFHVCITFSYPKKVINEKKQTKQNTQNQNPRKQRIGELSKQLELAKLCFFCTTLCTMYSSPEARTVQSFLSPVPTQAAAGLAL